MHVRTMWGRMLENIDLVGGVVLLVAVLGALAWWAL